MINKKQDIIFARHILVYAKGISAIIWRKARTSERNITAVVTVVLRPEHPGITGNLFAVHHCGALRTVQTKPTSWHNIDSLLLHHFVRYWSIMLQRVQYVGQCCMKPKR